MPAISCEEALARLWELLDGELDAAGEARVQEHLEICSRCYPQYDFRRAYLELTRRLRNHEYAPPGLRRRLFERILMEDARWVMER